MTVCFASYAVIGGTEPTRAGAPADDIGNTYTEVTGFARKCQSAIVSSAAQCLSPRNDVICHSGSTTQGLGTSSLAGLTTMVLKWTCLWVGYQQIIRLSLLEIGKRSKRTAIVMSNGQ